MGWLSRREPQIDEPLWQRLLSDYPFLLARPGTDPVALRAMTNRFLASKQFAGAQGLIIDDYIGAAIAVQACLPILRLGIHWYDDFSQIIVYPDQFRVRASEMDEHGLVHDTDDFLAGQTFDQGPVLLSWADARGSESDSGFNVVIHEFVHKIDLRDGLADGCPPLASPHLGRWRDAIEKAYHQFVDLCNDAESRLPETLDPDSEEAAGYFGHLPLDPYAAQDPAEFFAVCGETFFTDPEKVLNSFPVFYQCLEQFFQPKTLNRKS